MTKLLIAILVSAGALCAQNEPPAPKLIELKYANAEHIRRSGVLAPYVQSLNLDPNGRYVVISALTAQKLAAAEELLKRLDVPPKNVELTFHIVAGGAAATQAPANPVPADLEPVVKQLRSTFPFPAYRLIETAMLRTRDGSEGFVQGVLATGGSYNINLAPIRVTDNSPRQVRLNNLRFRQYIVRSRTEKGPITDDAYVTADIDVKEGQKVVVGKSTMHDNAIFLIVSARVID